jgi:tetratricopeptide (TPR) repeat protein
MNELILLSEFWQNQTVENYMICQNYLYQSKSFDPFEKYIERLDLEFENKNYIEFINSINETMQLSLQILHKLSVVYKALANKQDTVKYFTRAAEVAQVILSTGDGTRNFPYQIIYQSDYKEVLPYLQEIYYKHSIITYEDKKLSMVLSKNKKEYFFEITKLQKCKENAVSDKVDDMIKWFEKQSNRPL